MRAKPFHAVSAEEDTMMTGDLSATGFQYHHHNTVDRSISVNSEAAAATDISFS
ncbi:hypothetical protein H6P81_019523 [Aristolochia fimbriata]|uniref:Uncharacterized protein n=1 Tax=Aristolochia fimbriata TaxID=158543 RepID=A0AAV7DS29_ARIFI|nr:hypothetical protein H6P81_019523 [Aristolochia fimbriata]